jgi:hypothetical protein
MTICFHYGTQEHRITKAINRALEVERSKEPKRNYIGASIIGRECERQIQFMFFKTPMDTPFDGQKLRIFELGHKIESLVVRWFRMAGFDLETDHTFGPNMGEQVGFSALDGRFKGHRDGCLRGGPSFLKYPALWECKGLADKYFKAVVKNGVRAEHPEYFGQIQIQQAYFELDENPAVFTVINKNTCELYHEMVPFDPAVAQDLSDKAYRIIQYCDRGLWLPRISNDPTWYKCRFCSYSKTCHKMEG